MISLMLMKVAIAEAHQESFPARHRSCQRKHARASTRAPPPVPPPQRLVPSTLS
jgi:hypothetical protein